MSENKALQIDIEKIISEKLPKLASKLPRFVFKYLKKTLHQDDINSLLGRTEGISGLPFVTEVMKEFKTSVNAVGQFLHRLLPDLLPGVQALYLSGDRHLPADLQFII